MLELLAFLKNDFIPFCQDLRRDVNSIANSLGQIAALALDIQAQNKKRMEEERPAPPAPEATEAPTAPEGTKPAPAEPAKHKAEKKPQ